MPQPLHDPLFGSLSWDGGYLAWLGKLNWSPSLQLEILVGLAEDGSGNLAVIQESWEWLRAKESGIRQQVVDDLLNECNDAFRPDNPASRDELLQNIELHQVRLEDDGSIRVLYNDGYLFGGHVFWADIGADKRYQGISGID